MTNDVRLRDLIRAAQIRWAVEQGLSPDSKGYLANLDLNLFRPMSVDTLAEYSRGRGRELGTKMRALHSSATLVCNVFEYWRNGELGSLGEALEVNAVIERLTFEEHFRTGLRGTPPHLDVALWLRSGNVWGIESKFVEPFETSKPGMGFKAKYFPASQPLWTQHGLTKCGILANSIKNGEVAFNYLDAAQLLKHVLGLQVNHPSRFTLCYLYFDAENHPEAIMHRAEIAEFNYAIGGDFPFVELSYQTLIQQMKNLFGSAHNDYLGYIEMRYRV